MTKCNSCGKEVTSTLQFCPNCGRRVDTKSKSSAHVSKMTGNLSTLVPESAYLEFLGGPEDGRIVYLSGERVTVGRKEDNDVVIESDTALSRRHAFIYWQDGHFRIEDRKSSFGTWVAGERIPVETFAPIHDGNLIRLAFTNMLFHLERPDEEYKGDKNKAANVQGV